MSLGYTIHRAPAVFSHFNPLTTIRPSLSANRTGNQPVVTSAVPPVGCTEEKAAPPVSVPGAAGTSFEPGGGSKMASEAAQ